MELLSRCVCDDLTLDSAVRRCVRRDRYRAYIAHTRIDVWFISDTVEGLVFVYK